MTRILLLDPDPTHRGWLRRSLESSGIRVTDAADSTELGTIDLSGIDVVLANAELPSGRATRRSQTSRRFAAHSFYAGHQRPARRRGDAAGRRGLFRVAARAGRADQSDQSLPRTARPDPTLAPAMCCRWSVIVLRCSISSAISKRWREPQSSLLILGESGSGKELVARAVHAASPRAKPTDDLVELRDRAAFADRIRIVRRPTRRKRCASGPRRSGRSTARCSSTKSAR